MTPKRRVHVGSSAERAEGDSSRLYTPFPSRVLVGDVTAGAIAPSVSLPITTVQNPSVPWAPLAYTAAPDVRQAIPIVPVDSAAVAPSSHRGSGASNGKSQSPPSMLVREAAKRRGAGLSGTPRVGGAPLPSRSVDAGDLLDAGLGALYYSVGTGVIEHEAHERRRHLLLGTEAVQAGRMAEGTEWRRESSPTGVFRLQRYQTLCDADAGIAKRCVRAMVFGGFIPDVTAFRNRIGVSLPEAKRLYESMCLSDIWRHDLLARWGQGGSGPAVAAKARSPPRSSSAGSPSRLGTTRWLLDGDKSPTSTRLPRSPDRSLLMNRTGAVRAGAPGSTHEAMRFFVHNCLHEVLSGTCSDWARWFATISRRRVEDAMQRLCDQDPSTAGKMLQRNSRGLVVQLHSPSASHRR